MLWFKTLVLWIHIIAVIIWIGGIFFNAVVVSPVLRKRLSSPNTYFQLSMSMLTRFNRFTKEVVGAIILTGMFNLINHGWLINFNFSSLYLQIFFLKMIAVLGIIVLQAMISIKMMPAWEKIVSGKSEDFSRFEVIYRKINRINLVSLLLAFIAIFFAMNLKYV